MSNWVCERGEGRGGCYLNSSFVPLTPPLPSPVPSLSLTLSLSHPCSQPMLVEHKQSGGWERGMGGAEREKEGRWAATSRLPGECGLCFCNVPSQLRNSLTVI